MSFRLENPHMLLAFLPLLLLLGLQLYHWQTHRQAFGWRRCFFTLLGFSCGILALARVQAGSYELRKSHGEGDLYLAIDVSKSMLAEDILPTRLQFVAAFGEKLLQSIPKTRVAIFPFAADGFLLMPLSSDHLAAVDMLKGLSPTLTTDHGTDMSAAMDTLFALIQRRQRSAENPSPAQVILLSDGESHQDINKQVFARYRENKIPIFTVGVGTQQGSQLHQSLGYGNYRQLMRDAAGKPVTTRLDKEKLEKVAAATEGAYFPAKMDQIPLLAKRLNQRVSQSGLQSSFQVQREFFPELLMIAFLLLAIELFAVRWEYLVRSVAWLLLPLLSATALGWSEETEMKLSESGKNRGLVAYNEALASMKAGNFADAADLFLESAQSTGDSTLRKKALYNLGDAQLRQQDPIQAMAAYQTAMDTKATDPEVEKEANKRASDNLVLAARMQQQMQQQQQQGQKEKEDEGGQDQKPDPGGPKKDFKAQSFSKQQKQKMLDLVSEQEREVRSRLQKEKSQKKGLTSSGKDW